MTGSSAELFADRDDAGRRLGDRLLELDLVDPVVLGLPRGGVIVAARVAEALHAPLDVLVVRKLGAPFRPELAIGAIGELGVRIVDDDLVATARIRPEQIEAVEHRERATLDDRVARLRHGDVPPDLAGRTALVVDDGIATGATATAACRVARDLGASRVLLAAPVGPPDADDRVPDADSVICLARPLGFFAVGAHYRRFGQTSDAEVEDVLRSARRP
ncbi:hypothetical protein GCM10009840_23940 [Pseudolysinimonas kribbensis]|uniref:Phosphoribosyltransferase domain-containing protein n=1 Tax=Pseudolysinimonas kribbensis TaxID=433641 RepID=A0ABQ6K846_9MICO|nr:phosphoribosyltransferase family protein [Pseudolysinimonas kribbensis]GMA96851.1 hypothetical protein GCM10025881_36750 [Pseudolysinimonas kribbensis]